MLNHIVMMGRLTKDPDVRRTPNGKSVTNFTIACDRDFDKNVTDFVDVVTWNNTADFVGKYFTKGRMAIVSGRLQFRDWTDKEGNKRKATEIRADNVYFGDSKNGNNEKYNFTNDAYTPTEFIPVDGDGDDDDLPF